MATSPSTTTAAVTVPSTKPVPAKKKATATPSTSFPSPTTMPDGYRFELVVVPTCATVGQEMTATLRLKPQSGFALMVVYADGQPHEHWKAGVAEGDGTYVYKWRAAPVVGDGTVIAQASNPETNQKGTTSVPIKIVPAEAAC